MAEVIIDLEPGVPRLGIWCDGCLTSARYEFNVYAFGLGWPWVISTVNRCRRCDDNDE